MWLSIVLSTAGFSAFILAGAALRSLQTKSDRAARSCARYSVALGAIALSLGALWLSAAVLWPLEAAGVDGHSAPIHLLRAPMTAMAVCSALAVVALPFALLVLRAVARRQIIAELNLRDARRVDLH